MTSDTRHHTKKICNQNAKQNFKKCLKFTTTKNLIHFVRPPPPFLAYPLFFRSITLTFRNLFYPPAAKPLSFLHDLLPPLTAFNQSWLLKAFSRLQVGNSQQCNPSQPENIRQHSLRVMSWALWEFFFLF